MQLPVIFFNIQDGGMWDMELLKKHNYLRIKKKSVFLQPFNTAG